MSFFESKSVWTDKGATFSDKSAFVAEKVGKQAGTTCNRHQKSIWKS